MTTFNTIRTIAQRATHIERTPATDKQCAYIASLINEKLNGDLYEVFGVNTSNAILTSAQASEMIADLSQMAPQAPKVVVAEVAKPVFVAINTNGEYLNAFGEAVDADMCEVIDPSEVADYAYYMQRDHGVVCTVTTI